MLPEEYSGSIMFFIYVTNNYNINIKLIKKIVILAL